VAESRVNELVVTGTAATLHHGVSTQQEQLADDGDDDLNTEHLANDVDSGEACYQYLIKKTMHTSAIYHLAKYLRVAYVTTHTFFYNCYRYYRCCLQLLP
jgi:hypothetical protein